MTYAIATFASRPRSRHLAWLSAASFALALAQGCSGSAAAPDDVKSSQSALHAMIGPKGGQLVGEAGTPFEGVKLVIPAGALEDTTDISIAPLKNADPLPKNSVACGPMFELSPLGLELSKPATLTLPFSQTAVNDNDRFEDEVQVWWLGDKGWGQREQIDSSEDRVTVEVSALRAGGAGVNPPAAADIIHITFSPNPGTLKCLAQYPDDPNQQPKVEADIVRGDLNDGLFLHGSNIKPNLAFDMFTVERSSLGADGKPDPSFHGFGFAWYQSDLQASDHGTMRAAIRTILLDQIFGFDPDAKLAPTNTFEVGFWFNDPNDAQACGFDVTKPTPFNGDHKAGPVAMITTPDADTGLGPLCTNPDTSVTPARCDP